MTLDFLYENCKIGLYLQRGKTMPQSCLMNLEAYVQIFMHKNVYLGEFFHTL